MFPLTLFLLNCGTEVEKSETDIERYQKYCGICHGDNGEGYVAPQANALANPEFLAAATDEFLYLSTVYGRPGTKMSPWGDDAGGPLTAEEIDGIVLVIRSWETLPVADVHDMIVEGDATQGSLLYAEHCESCHGVDGEGETALSLNHPVFLDTISDGFLYHAIEVGRSGTPMMPYSEILGTQEIADIVVFIRGWESPE